MLKLVPYCTGAQNGSGLLYSLPWLTYVGQTGRMLSHCLKEHKQAFRSANFQPLPGPHHCLGWSLNNRLHTSIHDVRWRHGTSGVSSTLWKGSVPQRGNTHCTHRPWHRKCVHIAVSRQNFERRVAQWYEPIKSELHPRFLRACKFTRLQLAFDW